MAFFVILSCTLNSTNCQTYSACPFVKCQCQSPKKVNLVAALVRGMRVEDALLQLQVTVKRASKTVYQVMQSS